LDPTVTAHVLPTGKEPGKYNDASKLRYTAGKRIRETIARAEEATAEYLETALTNR